MAEAMQQRGAEQRSAFRLFLTASFPPAEQEIRPYSQCAAVPALGAVSSTGCSSKTG